MKNAVSILCCFAFIWMQAAVLFGSGIHPLEETCQCSAEATPCCPAPSPGPVPSASHSPVVRVAAQRIKQLIEIAFTPAAPPRFAPEPSPFHPPPAFVSALRAALFVSDLI